ncbi:MAG: lysine/arginine/ornithine ABC transporter substrate-binding protein [Pseudomonadota bacterium]
MSFLKTAVMTAAAALIATTALAEDKREVRIGTEGAYPPFNYYDQDGNLVGFDIDIANALCEAANFECTFVVQDWDGIIPGLQANKYDAIIASMSITPARAEVVDFTKKYYNTPGRFIVLSGDTFDLTPGSGLAGKRVGVQGATTHENFVRATWPEAEVVTYGTQDEANADLASARVDLVMADSVVLLEGFLKTEDGECCEFYGDSYNTPEFHGEGAGIAIRKGEPELVEAFNTAIETIRADGTYAKINEKYFDFDVYGAN